MRHLAFLALFSIGCGSPEPSPAPATSTGDEVVLTAAPGAEPTREGPTARELVEHADPAGLETAFAGDGVGLAAADEHACTTDADCVATTFAGCCAAPLCTGSERAVSRAWLDRQIAPCAVVECSGSGTAPACLGDAPPLSAACVAGACTAR